MSFFQIQHKCFHSLFLIQQTLPFTVPVAEINSHHKFLLCSKILTTVRNMAKKLRSLICSAFGSTTTGSTTNIFHLLCRMNPRYAY